MDQSTTYTYVRMYTRGKVVTHKATYFIGGVSFSSAEGPRSTSLRVTNRRQGRGRGRGRGKERGKTKVTECSASVVERRARRHTHSSCVSVSLVDSSSATDRQTDSDRQTCQTYCVDQFGH